MSKLDKTLDKMRNNPGDWRIEDIETIARRHGLIVRKPNRIDQYVRNNYEYPGI